MRERASLVRRILAYRLDNLLPKLMRESAIDMWLIICQEDDLDPVYKTLMPLDTWHPILQILVFCDRGVDGGLDRINVSMTQTRGLYQEEQWNLLRKIVEERDPSRIGINIGSVQWAAGGLTYNLHAKLAGALGARYTKRLVSSEALATRWLSRLCPEEIELYPRVCDLASRLITECYSDKVITPGSTTLDDLKWHYWQRCADLGIGVSFEPSFYLVRSRNLEKEFSENDRTIRRGDFVRCDVGLGYLRLTSDHQRWLYILRPEERDAPAGMKNLLLQANRLQQIFIGEFREGLSGNELLQRILQKARKLGIPHPKVFSHSVGLLLHEPGPLIGLPWEQDHCPGRGDIRLEPNTCFTMELSVRDRIPEWGGKEIELSLEEIVSFTEDGCRPIGPRQEEFYLV
jgi:hypothetical protein